MDQIDGDVVEATFHTLAAGEISSHKTGGYRHHDIKCDDQECLHPYPSLSGDLQYEELRYELEKAKTVAQQAHQAKQATQSTASDIGALLVAESRITEQAKASAYLLRDHPTHMLLTVKQNLALSLAIEELFTDESKVVVISDFKENIELVQRQKEPQQLHWNKPIFAYLSFVALRIKHGKLVIEYLDCWSLDTSHDFAWLLEAWQTVLLSQKGKQVFDNSKHIEFFSDNGPPFHSNDRIHTTVTKLALKGTAISTASMSISFFAPGEGKNLCDGHFGVLSRMMSIWIQNGNILERDPTPLVQMSERDVERHDVL